ncbi:Maf family protein [Ruminococcus sp.]|uniref:Maf family protein n=1 Tax=Ruminococcus sp. TaxID=41978 RepID=UPI002E761549|nr:Maf family protein [Ruminococcus sp.]MEE1264174.1 Maf family protein [Ruminococcus sp.]
MIILASASPRRQELLKLISEDFKIIPADIDESVDKNLPLDGVPEYLADKKAAHISALYPDDIVIGCDTGVFIDNRMLGKPHSGMAAYEMLRLLSGRTHRVITGCAIYKNGKKTSFSSVTEVEFYPLSNDEITAYVATGEPADKAGAYGIQGKGSLLIKSIRGDYFNVVGLPVARLSRALKDIQNEK